MEMFGFNRADAGEVVSENQMYLSTLKDANGKATKNKNINDYTFADYGLKNWKDLRDKLKPLKLDTTITPDNVKELFRNNAGEGLMGYEDYLKRKLILKDTTFTDHISGKYVKPTENRHQLFAHLNDVLNNPDKVWMNEYKEGINAQYQFRYVKFFNNKTLAINCKITIDGLEIKTWHEMKTEEIRVGLLIK